MELNFIDYFSVIQDPRIDRRKKHKLIDIIALSVCGLICDCDNWIEIERFCLQRENEFKKILELENGIPSHDTFCRVFSLIDPVHFQATFMNWVNDTFRCGKKEQIAIDGKAICALEKRGVDGVSIISGWGVDSKAVLAQVRSTRGKENLGFVELLKILDVKGCVVSMDSAGCLGHTTQLIIEKGGDFLVALKKNQRTMLRRVEGEFVRVKEVDIAESEDKGHGRRERRVCEALPLPKSFNDEVRKKRKSRNHDKTTHKSYWPEVKSACRVSSEREKDGVVTVETRYYLTSLEPDALRLLGHVRNHWGVENSLHYVLDVVFDEDRMRTRINQAVENTALMRKVALNLVKKENSSKDSMKLKRKRASWDFDYLLKILGAIANPPLPVE